MSDWNFNGAKPKPDIVGYWGGMPVERVGRKSPPELKGVTSFACCLNCPDGGCAIDVCPVRQERAKREEARTGRRHKPRTDWFTATQTPDPQRGTRRPLWRWLFHHITARKAQANEQTQSVVREDDI